MSFSTEARERAEKNVRDLRAKLSGVNELGAAHNIVWAFFGEAMANSFVGQAALMEDDQTLIEAILDFQLERVAEVTKLEIEENWVQAKSPEVFRGWLRARFLGASASQVEVLFETTTTQRGHLPQVLIEQGLVTVEVYKLQED